MKKTAKFGPGGNSAAFTLAGKKSSLDSPKWVKDMGLDLFEYECGNGVYASDETFAKIGLNAVNEGIELSLHSPYFISLSGVDPEKRLGSIKYILQSLNASKCLGARTIVIHAGSAAKIYRALAMEYAADTIKKALAECEKTGLDGIKLGLETMGKVNQLGTFEEIIKLCKMDERLVPVIDFGHLYARALGEDMNEADKFKRCFDIISKELGSEIAENLHCHFSCIEYSKGGEVKHLTFDNGTFGPSPYIFAKTVRELGVTPRVICESAGTQDIDALYMKKVYLGEVE